MSPRRGPRPARPVARRRQARELPARAALVLLVLATVLVTACGAPAAPPAAAPPPPPWFDPPLGFAEQSGRLFAGSGTRVSVGDGDELPLALTGDTVWAVDGGRLDRVDASGRATPVALPPGRTAGGRPLVEPPQSAGAPAGERVLVGAATVVPGSGTTPPGLAAEVVAVDPATATVTATAGAALPWSARPGTVRLRVPGSVTVTPPGALPGSSASRSITVLSVATDARRTTLGVDLAARRVAWTADGVEASAVAGGTVFGVATPSGRTASYSPSSVVALDAGTGARRATVAEGLRTPTVVAAGPAMVAVGGRAATTSLFGTGATSLRLVDPDGRTVRTVDTGATAFAAPPRCVWDAAATTVCATGSSVSALDATSGAPLWSLPDRAANRVAPSLTTAWHGAVYGTTVNGPVVLDARTGADRDPSPGIAPSVVNGRLGVTVDRGTVAGIGGGAAIHPATR